MIENTMKGKLPAMDDENLRQLNTKKVVDAIDGITNFVKAGSKEKRMNTIYLAIIVGIIVLLFGGMYLTALIRSGGLSNFADNIWVMDNLNYRIVCFDGQDRIIYRLSETREVYYFKESFPEFECMLLDKGEIQE